MGWGELVGAGIQAFASHVNSALNWAASKDIASDNYDYSLNLANYQNQMNLNNLKVAPSYQMQGLRKAGINPISAYGNLANIQTQTPAFTGARPPELDSGLQHIGKMLMTLEKYRSDLESAKKQREVADSEIALNNANANLVEARRVREENTTPTATQDAEQREAALRKVLAETWSQTFGAYAGLKSAVHIKAGSLAKMLGVDIGATVFLGDIMALSVAGLYKPDEVRDALRQNTLQLGIKDPVKDARNAVKDPKLQSIAKTASEKSPSELQPKPDGLSGNSAKRAHDREIIRPGRRIFEDYNKSLRNPRGNKQQRINPSFKSF